ncbi:uncharacterized protein TNCV_3958581 [Trichonephila clavipes]|nr:uncharacterized protein TNCV_3958581 [Trichonephila clavipes]
MVSILRMRLPYCHVYGLVFYSNFYPKLGACSPQPLTRSTDRLDDYCPLRLLTYSGNLTLTRVAVLGLLNDPDYQCLRKARNDTERLMLLQVASTINERHTTNVSFKTVEQNLVLMGYSSIRRIPMPLPTTRQQLQRLCWGNNHIVTTQMTHLDDFSRGRNIGHLECGRIQQEVSEELGIDQSIFSRLWLRFQNRRLDVTAQVAPRVTTPSEDQYSAVTAKRYMEHSIRHVSSILFSHWYYSFKADTVQTHRADWSACS